MTGVSKATGSPEILDGRVKTLHPKIHGGILARRDLPEHVAALEKHAIPPIDVVVVNLYPFEDKVAKGASFAEAIEHVDIGGPTMVRAAAKNFESVAVVVDPIDYPLLLEQLDREGGIDRATRLYFAQKAFRHTGRYEAAIAAYFSEVELRDGRFVPAEIDETFPFRLNLSFEKAQDLRYGENPHQRAAFYSDLGSTLYSVAAARQMQGKELSFNNILDLDSAWRLVTELDEPACVIVKHTNPCGTGLGKGPLEAYERAWAGDPTSAFGGVMAFNVKLDAAAARALVREVRRGGDRAGHRGRGALGAREEDQPARDEHGHDRAPQAERLRPAPRGGGAARAAVGPASPRARALRGGHQAQAERRTSGKRCCSPGPWRSTSSRTRSCSRTPQQTVGVGAGQMSRVDSARIAAQKAVLPLAGTVVGSDAFFPFRDGIDEIAPCRRRGDHPAGRLGARRGDDRGRRRARPGDGLHRRAPLPALRR